MAQWTLTDVSTGTPEVYTFPINPTTFEVPGRRASITQVSRTSPGSSPVFFQGHDEAVRGRFGGAITTQAMYGDLKTWTNKWYPLVLTDDEASSWNILIVDYTVARLHRAINRWRYDYQIEFIEL